MGVIRFGELTPIDLGHGQRAEFTFHGEESEPRGLIRYHPHAVTGEQCQGAITFRGMGLQGDMERPEWDVISTDPLTLSPSLKCRTCGSHGHIRNGRWEPC